jgi:hypothetical protein
MCRGFMESIESTYLDDVGAVISTESIKGQKRTGRGVLLGVGFQAMVLADFPS